MGWGFCLSIIKCLLPLVETLGDPIMLIFSSQPPETLSYGLNHSLTAEPVLLGVTKDGALCRLSFAGQRSVAAILREWKKEWPQTLFKHDEKRTARIKLMPRKGAKEMSILLVGTDFQHRVWGALLDIPCGQTVSYAELAKRIGKPSAARAVGHALGANPVPLLVPCHRVLAAGGKIGGYTGGLETKKRLLKREGLIVR